MRSRPAGAWRRLGLRLVVGAGLVCVAGAPAARAGAAGAEPGHDPASKAIGFYQRHISSLRHARCPFEPSCSQYALEVIRSRGMLAGAPLVADRLMRCNAAAARFYARGPSGRLHDPAQGPAPPPSRPRVPAWLLPTVREAPPWHPDSSQAARTGTAARLAEVVSFAEELARDGDCERAATEFARAAHVENADPWRVWAHLRSGDCYFAHEAWSEAEAEFRDAARFAGPEGATLQARALAAACRFNRGDFAAAQALLAGADAEPPPAAAAFAAAPLSPPADASPPAAAAAAVPLRTRALGLQGLCDMARGDWARAQDAFRLGLQVSGETLHPVKLRFLAETASHGPDLPRRSPGLAAGLSALVPGTGQMYAGRWQDGLRHLIFNAALLYTVVELAHDRHYAAAYLVAGVELPFYLGNVRGARGAARSFEVARRMEFVAGALAQTDR
jgi:putative membrane protein insertion efficiency factor